MVNQQGFHAASCPHSRAAGRFQTRRFCAGLAAIAGLMAGIGGFAGCSNNGPSAAERERTRLEGETIFGSGGLEEGAGSTPAAPWATWSIVLGVYEPTARARAQESLDWIRSVGGLSEARLERRGSGLVVAYGIYQGADDPEAQADLQRLRATVVDGTRPYAGAMLAPPILEQASTGRNSQWDLAAVKSTQGPEALYTLQVGMYGRTDGAEASARDVAEFRASAEKAVAEMRGRGEEAYYFHSPQRSTVTIGVFGQADYDPLNLPGYRSPALQRAWDAYPHNLFNGQAIREKVPGVEDTRLQPSLLVAIPG